MDMRALAMQPAGKLIREIAYIAVIGLCLTSFCGCRKKCGQLSTCPGGDDYETDVCGCKPAASPTRHDVE